MFLGGQQWLMNTPADKAQQSGSSCIHHTIHHSLKDDDVVNEWVKLLLSEGKEKEI